MFTNRHWADASKLADVVQFPYGGFRFHNLEIGTWAASAAKTSLESLTAAGNNAYFSLGQKLQRKGRTWRDTTLTVADSYGDWLDDFCTAIACAMTAQGFLSMMGANDVATTIAQAWSAKRDLIESLWLETQTLMGPPRLVEWVAENFCAGAADSDGPVYIFGMSLGSAGDFTNATTIDNWLAVWAATLADLKPSTTSHDRGDISRISNLMNLLFPRVSLPSRGVVTGMDFRKVYYRWFNQTSRFEDTGGNERTYPAIDAPGGGEVPLSIPFGHEDPLLGTLARVAPIGEAYSAASSKIAGLISPRAGSYVEVYSYLRDGTKSNAVLQAAGATTALSSYLGLDAHFAFSTQVGANIQWSGVNWVKGGHDMTLLFTNFNDMVAETRDWLDWALEILD
jgi:hypothetical protein